MNKTWIITQREFTSRVRKKTFLLTTILLPLLFAGFYAAIIWFSVKGGDAVKVLVSDQSNVFEGSLKSDGDISFHFLNQLSEKELKDSVKAGSYEGYMFVPQNFNSAADSIRIRTAKSLGVITRDKVEKRINTQLKEHKMLTYVSKAQLDSVQRDANLDINRLENESKQDKSGMAYLVGMISGFLIYIVLFIYGTMVMRGVMEEKVNRIAEVIVSSVKPTQLMMGKILGIGAVGLVQFLIWIVLGTVVNLVITAVMAGDSSQLAAAGQQVPQSGVAGFFSALGKLDLPLIIGSFLFYFLGGYFLYSSLFAAVGSAVNEDPQDAQSLLLPVMLPIIVAIVIAMKAVNAPTSGLAVFGSLFPLTSPVVMMARVAHGIPDGVQVWELVASMVFLILGFLGTTWLAGKIYRTGILLYGKKTTWKEMWKWAFRKN
ncbi:MAG: ABC transporter permease [Pseudobacter sp.]|uniref:ABC transporter permease n=1 Tax=Pseudobacter sp. TaxID=2045420 RepID=UPI003F7EAE22